jgi:hypothetical protein
MRKNISLLISLTTLIATLCTSCKGCGSGDDKNGNPKDSAAVVAPPVVRFDTAAFLSKNNIATADFFAIPPGGTQILHVTSVYFPHFEMGDNSTLLIGPELDSCTIIIANGQIGENCVITSAGSSAPNAPDNPNDPWRTGWWQAAETGEGARGVNGIDGRNGTSGKKIIIKMGLLSLGSLKITASGGSGGNGSKGGNGQVGGNRGGGLLNQIRSCGDGGDGGNGGHGGDAGNGGDLLVRAWPENGSINIPAIQQNLSAVSQAGTRGLGGPAGHGSRGGDNCPSGADGRKGNDGVGARNGIVDLQVIAKPVSL